MHQNSFKKNYNTIQIIHAIVIQKYKEYKNKILNKYFNKISIKPLMKYREIEIIEDILKKLQPDKCLEWGGGYSTLYFPSLLNKRMKWFSIEHNKDWADKVQEMNTNPDVEIFGIEPNHFPWTDSNNDGAYSDLKNYIEFPGKLGHFDFIFIDGRARKHCLIKALELANSEAVVVLHDANRQYYHESFKHYKHQILFKNYRDSHGLWIGSKENNLQAVFDADRHEKLWQIYNKMASFFQFKAKRK